MNKYISKQNSKAGPGNSLGLGIVEVLIALGLMGVVFAALAGFADHLQKLNQGILAQQELAALQAELQATMNSAATCSAALGVNQDFVLTRARQSEANGLPVRLTLAGGETLVTGQRQQGRGLQTDNLVLTNAENAGVTAGGDTLYRMDLWGRFRPTQIVAGAQSFRGRVMTSLVVAVNSAGKMVSCFGGNIMDLSTLELMCTGMGLTWDVATSTCSALPPISICQRVQAYATQPVASGSCCADTISCSTSTNRCPSDVSWSDGNGTCTQTLCLCSGAGGSGPSAPTTTTTAPTRRSRTRTPSSPAPSAPSSPTRSNPPSGFI